MTKSVLNKKVFFVPNTLKVLEAADDAAIAATDTKLTYTYI